MLPAMDLSSFFKLLSSLESEAKDNVVKMSCDCFVGFTEKFLSMFLYYYFFFV